VITYKALVEAGWSKADAADYAKNLTVNFNRKGASNALSAAYLFFNPAVQGTARLWQAVQTPQGKAVATSLFALGFIAGMTGNAGGDDDKNGIPDYQQLSDWDRATNLTPFTKGPKIPLPYGWNAFYAVGNFMSDAFYGRSPMGAVWASMKAAQSAFNPFGSSDSKTALGWAIKQASPTLTDPLVALYANESDRGGQITRTQDARFGPKMPEASMGKASATTGAKWLSSVLGKIGGGSASDVPKIGMLDINPDAIDYFAGAVAPGILTTAARSASTIQKIGSDEPIEMKDIPVARRVVSSPSPGKVYEALGDAKEELGNMLNIPKNGSAEERRRLAAEHPGWAGVAATFTALTQQTSALQKRKAAIVDGKIHVTNEAAEKKSIDDKVTALDNRMLKRYNETAAHW
jgi:hypothetical protein